MKYFIQFVGMILFWELPAYGSTNTGIQNSIKEYDQIVHVCPITPIGQPTLSNDLAKANALTAYKHLQSILDLINQDSGESISTDSIYEFIGPQNQPIKNNLLVWSVAFTHYNMNLCQGKGGVEALPESIAIKQKMIKTIILKGREDINKPLNESGSTLLHMAAFMKDTSTMQTMVSLDADVNAAIKVSGYTPLHLLATPSPFDGYSKNISLVSILAISDKFNINVSDNNGNTFLHIAVMNIPPELPNMNLSHIGDGSTFDPVPFIGQLLKIGSDKKKKNIRGETAFDIAQKIQLSSVVTDLLR